MDERAAAEASRSSTGPTGIAHLQRARRLLVVLGVVFCGLVPVMGRMQSMRMRDVRVMARLFVIARFVVLRRFAMMVGGSLMMLGCDLVVAATLVGLCAHVDLLSFWSLTAVRLRPESDRRMNAAIVPVDEPVPAATPQIVRAAAVRNAVRLPAPIAPHSGYARHPTAARGARGTCKPPRSSALHSARLV